MSVIFIDYPDGAGGEYLSHVISLHRGFYQGEYSTTPTSRHNHESSVINFLNSQAVIKKLSWKTEAKSSMLELTNLLDPSKNYCIPYHIMNHDHYELIREVWPDCKIVRIQPSNWVLVNLEFIRKVSLTKLQPKDIRYYFPVLPKIKFKLNDFLCLDLNLIWNNQEITSDNRVAEIDRIYNTNRELNDVYDYCVSWDKLFGAVETIHNEYYKLCSFLDITPNLDILDKIVERNTKNLMQLQQFDLIKECKKFNISLKEDNYNTHTLL